MATPASEKPTRHKRRSSAMKPKAKRQRAEGNTEPAAETEVENAFKDDTDLCDQLMSRYSTSTAPHHRHLLATAAAFRSILSAESRDLTPTAYFLAGMENLSDSEALDSTAVAALSTLVSIATPLIPEKGMANDRATESVAVLVGAVLGREEALGVSTLSGVVKCLGVLTAKFCDLEDWNSVKQGVETLLKLSVDKRPKLRRAAQECLVEVLKSFSSSDTIKEASKLVLSLLKSYTPLAVSLNESETVDASNAEASLNSKHLELLHVLNLLKATIPHLSVKIGCKILAELVKLMASCFLPHTRNVFQIAEVFLTTSTNEVIGPHVEDIANSLASYVLSEEKNPVDTVFSAARLLKVVLDKLQARGSCSWMKTFPTILGRLTGLLSLEGDIASQATDIIKELINQCIDVKVLLANKGKSFDEVREGSQEVDMIKATCHVFELALSSCTGVPNEQILSVISVLFQRLGEFSFIFMEGFVVKLADFINHANPDSPETTYLQSCLGSAVVALGPEKILGLIPICFDANSLTCSNTWLVPILKDHVVGASLEFYVEHIVPLAKTLQRASRKVKKSVLREELQALSQRLLALVSAFCRYPVDTHKKFESLTSILIVFLQKDPSMHKSIAVALKALVSQNRSALGSGCNVVEMTSNGNKDLVSDSRNMASYSIKVANRNIKALASHSRDLLQTLIDVFIDSPPQKRLHLKEAIGCLASIAKSSVTKKIFLLLLKKLKLVNTAGEFEEPASDTDELVNEEDNTQTDTEKTERSVIMDLASCFVEGASEELIQLTYKFITYLLQETNMSGHCEAYCTLSKILEHHGWFCSSQSVELIDLLVNLKPPVDIKSLKYRFNCFHILVVHTLEKLEQEEDNPRTFLILNEIILTLKDGKDEARKVASDALIAISSQLRKSSQVISDELYHKLISMILGYLSGSSAHIKSGAVSALSVLVYNDADICLNMTDLVPSVLSLLQNKDLEVAKAALGFMKVVVSCLEAKDLQGLVSDILNEVLPWSSVSRNHLRSKVTIILEILLRKCSSGVVQSVTPDKYKSFVKTVLQSRHQKSDSQGSGVKDDDTRIEGSSSKGSDNEAGLPDKGPRQGSSAHKDRKRKWENKNENQRAGDGGGSNRDKRQRQQPKHAFGGGKRGGPGPRQQQQQQRTGRNSSGGGGMGKRGGFKQKAN
ncbi:unnamed protein product [Linum tenue]|uniref:Ribosomal RNA-processing protein 12-like conserved domain-containing protein n=1 Tax=Linum tenue TaxID=586396 RepID=A0AAV0GPN8_9ROSI|nr:unnamed protein product [Linum tenue]